MMIKCKICGKEFEQTNKSRVLCSDECRMMNKRVMASDYAKKVRDERRERLGTRTCEVCGKEFIPRNSIMVRCSSACTEKRLRVYANENKRLKREQVAEDKKLKKNREKELLDFNLEALHCGKSYGKHEMTFYLAKQSDEMARRRRELDLEWERKRKNGN